MTQSGLVMQSKLAEFGLRLDPISLLLFVLSMEYFSRLMLQNTRADNTSIKIVKETLRTFAKTFGLHPNHNKSTIFFDGVPDTSKSEILSLIGFQEGKLPVKYLGLPLVSSRFSNDHCNGLIQRITTRVNSWSAKSLSFAGRLQLINSVLLSMQIYWCSVFLLPKAVIKGVESICREFLWNNQNSNRKSGPVGWKNVCTGKCYGGLRIKSVLIWNKPALVKHIWGLITHKPSLWATWVTENKLKRLSFWGIDKHYDFSWAWRQLLKLRNSIKDKFEYQLGNGERFSFWQDPRVDGLSLTDRFPGINIKDSDVSKYANVSRQIPRHSFIKWMALLGRLNTKDKIMKFSSNIWEKVLQISDRARQSFTWKREVSYIVRRAKGKSIRAKLMKMWFNASVYHIWMTRNKIVFAQETQTVDQVFKRITADVRNRL
ncbi:uncharacterized protein LOC126681877 [Mercurialis annua]|uniref:uncharacterized protein LOC126681877 n=1 Tax=Mercurialis annua TaxID=3986 RepID=UPI0021601DD6|nr:uncharacterized protein LOC126681877 [Mercurialis annua]